MAFSKKIDIEDVLGIAGVAVVAVGLGTFGVVWALLFLGVVLLVIASAITYARRDRIRRRG